MEILKDGEKLHDLQLDGYQIIQSDDTFRFGLDAVLLADFANAKKGETAVDLGTGQGIIPILLCAKTEVKSVTGVEIQEKLADMASRSVIYNKLTDKINIINADLKMLDGKLDKASYDLVVCNPPYKPLKHGLKSESYEILAAKHELLCTIDDVVKAASSLLKFGSRLCMCCRPERLFDIMNTMRKYKVEPKRIRFVHGKAQKPPSLLLIEGKRGSNPGLKVEAPLIVYNNDGAYTKETEMIYGRKV